MAVDTGSVYSDVRVRLDKLKGDIAATLKEFDKLGDGIGGKSKETEDKATKAFKGIEVAAAAAFTGIAFAIKGSITAFASFEQTMANVQSVARATPEEFAKLEEAARAAGEATKFSASQAADALYNLASAGFDATQATQALDGVLALAAATGSDLATASGSIASALSQYSLEASDATRVSNVFAAAIANSQANMEKLTSAFRQVGPVAGALGISLEETTGALQILFNAGFQGEQAGTILRNALSQLADTAGPASQKLQELGIDMSKVNPATNSLADVIGTLSEANLSAGDAIRVFGTEAGPGLLTLLNAGRKGIEDYTEAVTGTNAAAEASALQMNTLNGDILTLQSALESIAISVGSGFEPALRVVVQTLTELILWVNKLPGPVKAAGLAIVAGATSVGALSTAMGVLGITINTAVLGPLGLLAGALAAVFIWVEADKQQRVDDARLKFAQLGEELGKNAAEFDEFAKAAADVDGTLEMLGKTQAGRIFESAPIQRQREQMEKWAESAGLTADEFARIVLENDKASASMKEIARTMIDQRVEAERIKRVEEIRWENQRIAYAEMRENFLRENPRIAAAQLAQQERERAAEQARAQAAERERSRNEAIISARTSAEEAYRNALSVTQRLVDAGAITQEDAVERQISASQRLIEALAEVGYTATTGGAAGQRLFNEGLQNLERLIGQQKTLNELAKGKEESERLAQEALEKSKAGAEAAASAYQKYKEATEEVGASTEQLRQLEKSRTEETLRSAGANEEAIKQVLDAIDEYYEKLDDTSSLEKQAQDLEDFKDQAIAAFFDISSAYGQFLEASAEAEVKRLEREMEDKLAAEGLLEESKLERLQREYDAAKAAGDEEAALEASNAIKREKIEAEYQKKIAMTKYKADLAAWRITLAQTLAESAHGIQVAVASAPWPLNLPAVAFAGAQAGLNVAAVSKAKPEMPRFETGGIVPGNSFVGDNVMVRANSGEGIFTREQMDALGMMIGGGSGGGGPMIINNYIDGKLIAENSAEYYNNRQVLINVRPR